MLHLSDRLFYHGVFMLLSAITLVLYFDSGNKLGQKTTSEEKEKKCDNYSYGSKTKPTLQSIRKPLLNRYLLVYCFATLGDWMQGPYLYSIYRDYGYSANQIQILFVTGFSSSMLVGTIIGSFADIHGRKLNCLLYFLFYSLSCLSIHIPDSYLALVVGRVLGGAATSILMTAFESWIVRQHAIEASATCTTTAPISKFHQSSVHNLKTIFSYSTAGNSAMAILAGVFSQYLSSYYGPVKVFDCSAIVLLIGMVVCQLVWTENYGGDLGTDHTQLQAALLAVKNEPQILKLGLIQALFEAAMYCFVLEWTPALSQELGKEENFSVPYGIIFSCFMLCITIGSWVYKYALSEEIDNELDANNNNKMNNTSCSTDLAATATTNNLLLKALLVSFFTLLTPTLSTNPRVRFVSFCVYEANIGIFWPCLATLRSKFIPENVRATLMNIFRIPLNLLVILILLPNLSLRVIFTLAASLVGLACGLQYSFMKNLVEID